MKKILLLLCLCCLFVGAEAATYTVNPARAVSASNFHSLSALLSTLSLAPGDVVEVSSRVVFSEIVRFAGVHGSEEMPVVFRSAQANRKAVFDGTDVDSTPFGYLFYFPPDSSNIVLDGFEIRNVRVSGDQNDRGIYVRGSNITIRNSYVHDCANGIFSSSPAFNTVIENSEIAFNGSNGFAHNVYLQGTKARVIHCLIHDAKGGINYKSRNGAALGEYWADELLYNRIWNANEGGYELDFSVHPEAGDAPQNARIVGNWVGKSNTGNQTMVMAFGNEGRRGVLYLAFNTFTGARGQAALLFPFGNAETTMFRNVWNGGRQLLVEGSEGFLYGDGNAMRLNVLQYSLSDTLFLQSGDFAQAEWSQTGESRLQCPSWVPSIAMPSYEPPRRRVDLRADWVLRTDGGKAPGAFSASTGCVVEN